MAQLATEFDYERWCRKEPSRPSAPSIELKHAEILRLEPGDVLLIKLGQVLSEQERDRVSHALRQAFPDNRVMVFENGEVTVTVVRQADGCCQRQDADGFCAACRPAG